MNAHFFVQVFLGLLVWMLIAVAVGMSIGPIMREDRRLFGILLAPAQKYKLFGFKVPKNVKRA